jgi:rare lipoprotein A
MDREKAGLSIVLYFKFLLLLCAAAYFSSCASVPRGAVQPPEVGYVTASWYGSEFHGRPTSSGEIFNMHALTCAHKEFPFGTRLRVTHLRNNKSVVVTVNDRGPFIAGRDLDLSYAAANEIGLIGPGTGEVRIEHLGRDMRYLKRVSSPLPEASGPFTVQVGAFKEETNASRLKQGLEIKYKDVYITSGYMNNQKLYRVRIGSFSDKNEAYLFANTLAEEGYSIFILAKE